MDSSAWDDINPPKTALARTPEPPSPPSRMSSGLTPATPQELVTELTACLTLCAPAGFTEAARTEWFKVARQTVGYLPLDLLGIGCDHARKVADHPSKIVPAIISASHDLYEGRRKAEREARSVPALGYMPKRDVMARRGEAMSEADTAELNERLERLGATVRYRADGSRYALT